jgi:spermidine synthase
MPSWLAGALVFLTSGAVPVLEILAGRLLAPYVGVRLETYTAVIGTVLAGIAVGSWLGGRLADRLDPRRVLGPLVVAGGGLAMLSVPAVRWFGTSATTEADSTLLLAMSGFFVPAAVLSAVSPTVVKLQLRDLHVTGQVVGRLSALGTAGAIAGTFIAGFVLVAAAPTSTVIVAVGAALVAGGLGLWAGLARPHSPVTMLALVTVLAVAAGGLASAADGPCDVETRYHCARVVPDPVRAGGRALWLDILRHSYVDLDDPVHLELRYSKVFADVIAATRPATRTGGQPLDTLHIGGGGFTMPRYLSALYPDSRHLVFEIDPELVDLAEDRLGLVPGPRLDVRVGDARLLMRRLAPRSQDLVLGDAFGDLAVPWHLTTLEFARDLREILRPGGLYVLNLIDHPPLRFARAQMATLAETFDHVAVIAPPAYLDGRQGGNFVVAASDRPFDRARIEALTTARQGEERALIGSGASRFADGGSILTDDYAPVDQWLARARRAP